MHILLEVEGFKVEDMPRASPAPDPLRGYSRLSGMLPRAVVTDENPDDVPW